MCSIRLAGIVAQWMRLVFRSLIAVVTIGVVSGPMMLNVAVPDEPSNADGRQEQRIEADWIARDRQYDRAKSSAATSGEKEVLAVTSAEDASGGCDGVKNGRWGFHTASHEQDPWWQVDLGDAYVLDRIVVFNRVDGGTAPRTRNLRVLVASERDGKFVEVYRHNGETFYGVHEQKPLVVKLADQNVTARVVRLAVPGRCSFALDEVEVYTTEDPEKNIALGKPADQKSVGPYSYPGTLPNGVRKAQPPRLNPARLVCQPQPKEFGGLDEKFAHGAQTSIGCSAEFSVAHTRDVIEHVKQLAERLRTNANRERIESLATQREQLENDLNRLEQKPQLSSDVRRDLYFRACRLARTTAFCNVRLDFDRLLFVKRHDAAGVFHMCDQYYGCNAVPGGGLYVLSDPLGPNPQLVNVLANSVVENGRLKGRKLEGGSFLSPELSFDGKTILFAYSEAKGWEKFHGKEAYEWKPEYCYHIFRCNVDGTGLTQLTDGAWDEFDPCFLPGGRIVFISMRRGGFLRCGRHCPTYTMFSMELDGRDIRCLSFHETHEWHPSVTNDGRIVYTRWDYVDRDTNVAHHIWTCYPDGRNPQTFHGNYPRRREGRPWMEMSIRAIPGSQKFVATAASHHGHAFGSLVLIDPERIDDGGMSQLTRLTPEVPFPEAEGGKAGVRQKMVYATAWPLSEDDYLCAYDPDAKNHGIYWIDRFGNKELIYRDPSIACLDPIPLRPRARPPVIPDQIAQTAGSGVASQLTAKVTVMNVYDSDVPWPSGTRITALRIIQVLPKTTPSPNQPRIGVGDQTNARAVLGTVPVEADGSVYFEAPAGKELYFQALDDHGLAVQSMRSGTYLHAGEELACQGCHAPKRTSPAPPARLPLALRRPASHITPDTDGSNPFSYVRLVQPVLDRHCVACHRQRKALDLDGTISGRNGWTRSYQNLAGRYAFYFNVRNGSINDGVHGGTRTIPGQFGARAAALQDYLNERHYGVQLSAEDRHCITLWLDCNSEFYGSYENTQAQARGEIVLPTLD